MNRPTWDQVDLLPGILREPHHDRNQIILWLPEKHEGGYRYWKRIANVPGAEPVQNHDLVGLSASVVRAKQNVGGFFQKMLQALQTSSAGQTWLHPDGSSAEQIGERQTDWLLVWTEDETVSLDETSIQECWPSARECIPLGNNLYLAGGIEIANPTFSLPGTPGEQAEQLVLAARQNGDRRAEALALTDLGAVLLRSDPRQAAGALDEALEIARQLGDPARESDVLGHYGLAMLHLNRPDNALQLLEQQLQIARKMKDRNEEKHAWNNLGHAYSSLREPATALEMYQNALGLARRMGDGQTEAAVLWSLAIQHAELRHRGDALNLAEQAIELYAQHDNPIAEVFAEHRDKYQRGDRPEPPAPAGEYTSDPHAGDYDDIPFPVNDLPLPQPAAPGPPPSGPDWLRLAQTVAAAAGRYAPSEILGIPAAVHRERLQTCSLCPFHTGVRCRVGGCFTQVKARLAHEKCPVGKWAE